MSLASVNDVRQFAKQVIDLYFSFRTKAGQNPDAINDGKSNIIKSVTRSGGVYTVTFNPSFPLPVQLTAWDALLASSATPTKFGDAYYVKGSYNPTARTVQFAVAITSQAGGASTVAEPDDGDWITCQLRGTGVTAFKSAAGA